MKKLTIYFDADDVLVEATLPAIERYNTEYNENLQLGDIKDFNMIECVRAGTSIAKYYDEPGFYRTFLPRPGMQDCIRKLAAEGHDLFIATSSPVTGILDKIACFEEHFPEFSWTKGNIIPITKKYLLAGDIIIDDKLENVLDSACSYKIPVDAPWNQDVKDDSTKFLRVKNADQIYTAIQAIIHNILSPLTP